MRQKRNQVFMYQPGFLESMQLKEESNIKHFVLYHVKHMVPRCMVSFLLLETWVQALWHEVLGVFFTG